MRLYLFFLAGITFPLLGWSISTFILFEGKLLQALPIPELITYPIVTAFLCFGIVLTELFVSNPTRPKLNLQRLPIPGLIAVFLGLVVGLLGSLFTWLLYAPFNPLSPIAIRILGWILIGLAVGTTDGIAWWWHSLEAGNVKRFQERLLISLTGGFLISLASALGFEFLRLALDPLPRWFLQIEDPMGFTVLGGLLGIGLGFTGSPSYQVALRAGAGFEFAKTNSFQSPKRSNSEEAESSMQHQANSRSRIRPPLSFVSADEQQQAIEEGLSIRLPTQGKFIIGSHPQADIYLPGLHQHLATLEVRPRATKLIVVQESCSDYIEINNESISQKSILLRHNHVLKFKVLEPTKHYGQAFYRFIFYNRALDPQA